MPKATLTRRVEVLEETVSELPARISAVERELSELRVEVRKEFAAVRSELGAEIRAGDEETRRYMRVLYEDLRDQIKTIGEGFNGH